jgi:hypothetical protein
MGDKIVFDPKTGHVIDSRMPDSGPPPAPPPPPSTQAEDGSPLAGLAVLAIVVIVGIVGAIGYFNRNNDPNSGVRAPGPDPGQKQTPNTEWTPHRFEDPKPGDPPGPLPPLVVDGNPR